MNTKPTFKQKLQAYLKLLLPVAASFTFAGITDAGSFENSMANFSGIVFLVPIFTEHIKTLYQLSGKKIFSFKASRLVCWILSFGLIYLSRFVGWGFADYSNVLTTLYALGAALVAGKYVSFELIQTLLALAANNIEKLNKLQNK